MKFYIRDIIWLTLLVAMNLAWYIYKVAPTRALEDQIEIGNRLIVVQKKETDAERERADKYQYRYQDYYGKFVEKDKSFARQTTAFDAMEEENQKLQERTQAENHKLQEHVDKVTEINGALMYLYGQILTDEQKEDVQRVLNQYYELQKHAKNSKED